MPLRPSSPNTTADAIAPASLFAIFLAVLGPIAVVAGPLLWWARPDPPQAEAPAVAAMDHEVAGDPDVVILGASKVYTDIDAAHLATGLGIPAKDVVKLNISGSTAPVWYAILKNRVYGNGKSPKLVIVYSTFDWALATAPTGEVERSVLLDHMTADDESVLRTKALGETSGGSPAWNRVRRRRTEDHGALMAWIRNAAVGLAFAPSDAPDRTAAGATVAAPALEDLFGMQAGLDATATPNAIPIVEREREKAKSAEHAADSLLPDFLALAKAHGAKIVFANAPVGRPIQLTSKVPVETMREAVDLINAAGAGYLDLWDLHLGETLFGDPGHLNGNGRTILTKALAERLLAIHAWGDAAITAAAAPVEYAPLVVTREGTPPAMPALEAKQLGADKCAWEARVVPFRDLNDFALQLMGAGGVSPLLLLEDGVPLRPHANPEDFNVNCRGAFRHQDVSLRFSPSKDDGKARTYTASLATDIPLRIATGEEAWWVYPGTTLKIGVAESPEGSAVAIDAVVLGPGTADPTVRVGDGAEVAMRGAGMFRSAVVNEVPPTGPWTVSIGSPPDGRYVLIRRLVAGDSAHPRFLVGTPGATTLNANIGDAAYASPPPEMPALTAPIAGSDPAKWALTGFPVPDTDEMWRVGSVAGCSPLRVYEDGKPLHSPVVRENDVKGGPGRFTQVGMNLFVSASDNTPPASNGRKYTVKLDDTRRCRGLRWLYPGDHLTLTLKPVVLARLMADATRLELGAAFVGETKAEATIRVTAGTETYLDTHLPLADLTKGPPAWDLPRPLPRTDPVTVDVSIPPDAPYVLVSSLAFSEPGTLPLPGAEIRGAGSAP